MDDLKQMEEKILAGTSPETVQDEKTETKVETEVTTETEQDPLKVELERVTGKKNPFEKAKDSLYFNAQRVKDLGGNPAEILGFKDKEDQGEVENEDDRPLTIGEWKKMQASVASKTARGLATEIPNETERELTLYHIQNTIKSTGNPQEDLKLARALTNSVRNSQILEESSRKPATKTHSSSSGQPGSTGTQREPEYTKEELMFLQTGVITKEDVLAAREKSKANRV